MLRSLCHLPKAIGILTMFIATFALPLSVYAETKSGEESDQKAPILTVAVINAMRNAIQNRFFLPGDLKDAGTVHLSFHVHLDKDGRVIGTPETEVSGGSERTRKIITDAALRAVTRAAPYTMFPKDKYDAWEEVILNFDASQLNL
ncbi:cell envelope integrity protein TolA [Rhizobium bangladeshense]|nr:cell envelope integrity protein TolA [Rhizobium bangladeshense]MBX5215564.1 cell envelope integrity protein TolA [Rhizobium sp. NLR9a]MBX5232728.1 cell envelope integrity protein TolA [Rhizobium sp. NLR4a]MBX5245361.1 cell envelope integrity protein TolA [Rhizobium sp. NLR3b]MBX5250361.1 cell envelope integrity protein TolA [Rhizobium sp. NLR4b]MBX5257235.1 cell envelope integrity protein TolA [Rhizobium sp. NLR16b]MBX5263327.1 cell envelope integrity protein TolA [Rhizobium sp. NLR16a]MB